mgnify:CR=1 FL=1
MTGVQTCALPIFAIAGLGTVGAGVIRLLDTNGALIAARAGRPIEVVAVSARDRGKDRGVDIARFAWEDDMTALARRDDVDVVVELVGGSDGPALALSRAALGGGKGLVTANKAMIAHHGLELAAKAELETRVAERTAQLADEGQRLALILEATQLGSWEMDMVRGTIWRSKRMREILGVPEGLTNTNYPGENPAIHPDDLPRLQANHRRVMSGEANDLHMELRFRAPSGEWRWMETFGRVVRRDHDDGIVGLPGRIGLRSQREWQGHQRHQRGGIGNGCIWQPGDKRPLDCQHGSQ